MIIILSSSSIPLNRICPENTLSQSFSCLESDIEGSAFNYNWEEQHKKKKGRMNADSSIEFENEPNLLQSSFEISLNKNPVFKGKSK